MTDRELMQMALDALELVTDLTNHDDEVYAAIDALRARLAQPEHGDGYRWREGDVPPSITYTTPPQREWQGLTDEEIEDLWGEPMDCMFSGHYNAIRAVETKLKGKNTK